MTDLRNCILIVITYSINNIYSYVTIVDKNKEIILREKVCVNERSRNRERGGEKIDRGDKQRKRLFKLWNFDLYQYWFCLLST